MFRISRQVAVAVAAVTFGAALSCDSGVQSSPDDLGPRTQDRPTSSVETDQRASRIWFALYSYRRGPAQFVSIDENRKTLFVEATSPNIEVASIVKVAQGQLEAETIRGLSEALQVLDGLGPAAIASMKPIEPIEQEGLLADVATFADGNVSSFFGLATQALPPDVSQALSRAAVAASKLDPHLPPSIVQVTPVAAARVERIRTDPRKFYSFIPIHQSVLDSSPHLLWAFRCPGLVVEANDAPEAARIVMSSARRE